jgi:hypothetical protein
MRLLNLFPMLVAFIMFQTDEKQTGQSNVFADPMLWQPDRDKDDNIVPGQFIEGTYMGFTPFEFAIDEITYCLTIDTGNGEYFALPAWFKIKQYVSMNAGHFVEGKTKVRLVFKKMISIGAGQSMADFDIYADGVKIGKPLFTVAQLKELHAAQPARVTQGE